MLIFRNCAKVNGGGTVRLTIPIEFVRKHGLVPGSPLVIDVRDDCMVIKPLSKEDQEKMIFQVF